MDLGGRSLAEIFQEIIGSVREIIRLEIQLAKCEVSESLLSARQAVAILVASAFVIVYALGLLLLAAVYGLSLVMPPWAAAITVGAVTAIIGGIGVMIATKKFGQVGIPKRTIASLQETVS